MSTQNKYARILTASASASILAVIAGLPVDANGFFVSEEQMSAIEAVLEGNETAIAAHATAVEALNEQLAAANTAREAAAAELATANASIAERDQQIATLNARITELENQTPEAAQTSKEADETGGKNVKKESAMDAFADSLLGKPKQA